MRQWLRIQEEVVITPRNFPVELSCGQVLTSHFAIIGTAYVPDRLPLYYEVCQKPVQFCNGQAIAVGAVGYIYCFKRLNSLVHQSRFVRAAFNKLNSVCGSSEEESVNQFFHILGSVEPAVCTAGALLHTPIEL